MGDDYLHEGSELWSWEQNKAFEKALVIHSEESGDRWEKIASLVPGKSVQDVVRHYRLLEEDVGAIDGDQVPLPSYLGDEVVDGGGQCNWGGDGKGPRAELERRKGIAWSEEEHRLFILGLEKFGKGDWRSISRNYVITRTPTQVASHAQKFFIRQQSGTKDKRRSSIHDITTVDDGDSRGLVAGEHDVPASVPGMSCKQLGQPPTSNPLNPSAPAIGQAVVGSHAVGTPINHPGPPNSVPPHLAFRMIEPVHNMVPSGVGIKENQMEKVYPEYQTRNDYPGNQMANAHAGNRKKHTHRKPHKRR